MENSTSIKRHWIAEIERIDSNFFKDLKNCTHRYDPQGVNKSNKYHLEEDGNVYGHTLMVYEKARELYPEDEILQLACLLHDIGKPGCRFENHEKESASFYNHESYGVFKAVGILNKLCLDVKDKVRVLELIQRHADSYKLNIKNLLKLYTKEKIQDIIKIRWCDTLGRIKQDDDGLDIEQIRDLESKIHLFKDSFETNSDKYPTCTILVGPPCSGKTTNSEFMNEVIVSRDNIVMQLGYNIKCKDYNESFKTVNQEVVQKEFQKNLEMIMALGKDFILDLTNMTAKSRMKYMSQKDSKKYKFNAVVYLNDLDVLLDRNSKRDGKVLSEKVIIDMISRFQIPYPGEGFNRIDYKFY